MRQLNPDLAGHLASGVTNLCHCWKLLRRDGVILCFTDHDTDLVFNGLIYAARTGLEGTKIESALGFSVGGMEVTGAFDADGLNADDLVNGKYDDATVELWLVNWADVTQNLLLDIGAIGQVKRGEFAFTAELRGLAHQFDQETGRLFQKACSADLGDLRCGVALANAVFSATDSIISTDGKTSLSANLGGYADGWFANGSLTFTSGANAGAKVIVKTDLLLNGVHQLELWTPLALPLAAGDVFGVSTGCDKSFQTCRTKFANTLNFRGFPHMPGNDVVFSYATTTDTALDGGSMNK
jgi:uncharacterized phage protein (TIGR02218 family)